ncbi:MAG: tetratricopeptide repeat protein [Acidobacteria bacterium]|nr:tetratricopeptide repeat protein [Acidobacteriota bacterium]MCB9399197.1 tetratricopeptide repeat protein [Acidobacteriota bacterium]
MQPQRTWLPYVLGLLLIGGATALFGPRLMDWRGPEPVAENANPHAHGSQSSSQNQAASNQQTHNGNDVLSAMTDQEKKLFLDLTKRAASGKASDLLDLGDFFVSLGHKMPEVLAQAIGPYQRVLDMYPKHGYTLKAVADVYYELNDHESAIQAYERYLAQFPNDANAHTDLGTQYFYSGENEKAIEQYQKAVAIFPALFNAYANMALVYDKMGRKEDAAKARATAQDVEAESGRQLAPGPNLPRLPEGEPLTPPVQSVARESTQVPATDTLESYFRNHAIIGPKMVGYTEANQVAVVQVVDFPVDQMPPMARQVFEAKVQAELQKHPGMKVEITDKASGKVLLKIPST